MVEATNELNNKINEFMDYVMKKTVSINDFMYMNTEDLEGIKMALGLVKDAEDLMFKQAAIIEAQSQKIDELLRIVKRMEQK